MLEIIRGREKDNLPHHHQKAEEEGDDDDDNDEEEEEGKAQSLLKKKNSDRALEVFDTFYKPVYQEGWPSIRISLLTTQKYGALLNRFCEKTSTEEKLIQSKAFDIIRNARNDLEDFVFEDTLRQTEATMHTGTSTEVESSYGLGDVSFTINQNLANVSKINNSCLKEEVQESEEEPMRNDTLPTFLQYQKNTSLENFVPATETFTEKELLEKEKYLANSFVLNSSISVPICKPKKLSLPRLLKLYSYGRGDINTFPKPKLDGQGMIEYFLFDAASILPVVALDVEPMESVLDMCSGPGGKSLAIMQSESIGHLTCNDVSYSRLQRVKYMMMNFLPEKEQSIIKYSKQDGVNLDNPLYNKVLVDVPCNTDRHHALVDENSLFSNRRIKERLELPNLQKDLLIAGIKSCKPDGAVVYSTCTLSPAQNDGVIQAAMESVWRETDMHVEVEDLSWMCRAFSDTFSFSNKTRFGQLVVPCLEANYGPMYICKIKKYKDKDVQSEESKTVDLSWQ